MTTTTTLQARPARSATDLVPFAGRTRRLFGELSMLEARNALEARPDAVANVHRPGPDAWRVLMFGAGVLAGAGFRTHELGLPGRVADRVTESTGRGVHLEVVVDAHPTSPRSLTGLAGLRLRRFDAVVVVLGDMPSQLPSAIAKWRGALTGLAKVLTDETTPSTALFVYESSEVVTAAMAMKSGRSLSTSRLRTIARMADVAEALCASTGRIRAERLAPALGSDSTTGRFSDGTYDDWADRIATRITASAAADATAEDSPKAFRNLPQDEVLRQRALNCLRLRAGDRTERLDREVAAAAAMFRVDGAAVNLIDGHLQWSKATTKDVGVIDRPLSICDLAIRADGLTG